ncbi:MAG: hypothetical protein PHG06_07495 [Parabacteroides sp.]|nr:hypothetical protein [Parabacteroides sp.]
MKRAIIAITDSGSITVPDETRMTIPEMADLFGIFYQTAKRHIRSIEKSGIAEGNYSMTCQAEGSKVYPVYYGLKMVIAVAFRVQSPKSEMLRRWVVRRTIQSSVQIVFTSLNNKVMMN